MESLDWKYFPDLDNYLETIVGEENFHLLPSDPNNFF